MCDLELSAFEWSLQPRRLIVPQRNDPDTEYVVLDTTVVTAAGSFTNEIVCAICMDVIDTTWTVMACLHRFCSSCLQKCLRMERAGNHSHECPLCRAKLASRRNCKADPLYDRLIATLMNRSVDSDCSNNDINSSSGPDGAGATGRATSSGADSRALPPTHSSGAPPPVAHPLLPWSTGLSSLDIARSRRTHFDNIQKFRKRQRESRAAGFSSSAGCGAGAQSSSADAAAGTSSADGGGEGSKRALFEDLRVNIALYPATDSTHGEPKHKLRKPFLALPSQATVGDLKDYLLLKMRTVGSFVRCEGGLDCGSAPPAASARKLVEIYMVADASVGALSDADALSTVAAEQWDASSELALYFRVAS